jgi:hypothetical protein
MPKLSKRKSISMREGEYYALEMQTKAYGERVSELTVTGCAKMILFGELPPIEKQYLEQGMRKAEEAKKERMRIKAEGDFAPDDFGPAIKFL